MALPLAPIHKPRRKRDVIRTEEEQIYYQGMTDAEMAVLVDAAKKRDIVKLRALLPGRGRLMYVVAHALEVASDFDLLLIWLAKAPKQYSLDAKWRFGAKEVRKILTIVRGKVDLEFNNHILRRVLAEDVGLVPRVKTPNKCSRLRIFYEADAFDCFVEEAKTFDLFIHGYPHEFKDLFLRDEKWAKIIWKFFHGCYEVKDQFRIRRDELIAAGNKAGLKTIDRICGKYQTFTY